MPSAVAIGELSSSCTESFPFDGQQIQITSAPEGFTLDISEILRDPDGFHGAKDEVHDLVNFGNAFAGLRGTNENPDSIFSKRDRDWLYENGIRVLADHDPVASDLVQEVNSYSIALSKDPRLYQNVTFCAEYLELARQGFSLVTRAAEHDGIPVSLERAGLVTTRLACGLEIIDSTTQDLVDVPNEVRVVTKRAHEKNAAHENLIVSVQWRDLDDIGHIDGQQIQVVDFVNPASGASVLGMLVSARKRGGTPSSVIHKSFMATEQGIDFAMRVMTSGAMGGVRPFFYTLGTSKHLTPEYYLVRPGVGDAGDVLCNFLPERYQY